MHLYKERGVIIECMFCLQVDGPVTLGGGGGVGGGAYQFCTI